MNSYDHQALDAIKRYHAKYGKYPRCVEATTDYRAALSQDYFEYTEPIPDTRDERHTRVRIVAVGTCDIVFHGILVKNLDINLEKAECATQEQFQRIGAKFARAGCLILEPKQTWGLQTYNPHLFFSQIEAFVFGEEAAFEVAMAEEHNHLPGD